MNDFRDKNIIITGAGRGLGKAIADRLTQENAKVIAFDKYFKNSSEYHQKVAVDFSNFLNVLNFIVFLSSIYLIFSELKKYFN